MRYLLFIIIVALMCNCMMQTPGLYFKEQIALVPAEYNLDEIDEYFPNYSEKFKATIDLYYKFKISFADSLNNFNDLLVEPNENFKSTLKQIQLENDELYIGLESIHIDSSYFFSDTIEYRQSIFKIGNFPIPLITEKRGEIVQDSTIENHLKVNCILGALKHKYLFNDVEMFKITFKTKTANNRVLINNIAIKEISQYTNKSPFLLRPYLILKRKNNID